MTKRFGRLLLAATAVGVCACEHGIDMEGTVIAPVEVQQLFSAEAPGQLFVFVNIPTPNELRDSHAVFCAPVNEARAITVSSFRHGCAQAGPVQVSAFAVPRPAEWIDCRGPGAVVPSPLGTYSTESFDPAAAVATANQEASLETIGSASCRDGRVAFTLTLAPRPTSGDSL